MGEAPVAAALGAWRQRPYSRMQLNFFRSDACPVRFCATVATCEFLHAPGGIDKLLFAREKRMASCANADFNVLPRRTRVVYGATGARDFGLVILRMNVSFHGQNRVENVGTLPSACKR